MPLAMNVGGFTPFQYSSRACIPCVEWSTHLRMKVWGLYTLPICIVCPDTSYRGVCAPHDECWRVYTLPIFIACPYIHCRGVYMTRNEYWSGVHPPNIHRVVLHPHLSGLYQS